MAKTRRALASEVHVQCPDDVVRVYGPGQVEAAKEVVDFLDERITNPAAWVDVGDDGEVDDGSTKPDPAADAPAGNASTEDWAQYAVDNQVAVPEGSTRAQIVEACRAAGLSV